MYKPYRTPAMKALPDIKLPEPRISKFVLFLASLFTKLYLFLFFGITRVIVRGDKIIYDAFKRALAKESRCIIAFRHPNGGEPQILGWFFFFRLKFHAFFRGVRFPRSPHAIFIYGYEVVRWGGWVARYVMPNVGALPIHHAKIDSVGMTRIFKAIVDGPYPVALAPEGQVTYSTDTVPRLEPGAIRIGFQAAKQLAEKDKIHPVEILPISVHFRFGHFGRGTTERLLKTVEKLCGFRYRESKKLSFTERLKRCREHILQVNERRYDLKSDESISFEERLEIVINTALETAERMLNIKSEGDFISRMYKVRQICWDRIYLPGVENFKNITSVERSVLDLKAGEAWHIGRHQELIDFGWYFRRPLPAEDETLHNKIEYVQNLWDFANRTMGGGFADRMNIFPRRVFIQAAPPINLTERLPAFKEDKKTAIAEVMSDLEKTYIDCISEMNKSQPDFGRKRTF